MSARKDTSWEFLRAARGHECVGGELAVELQVAQLNQDGPVFAARVNAQGPDRSVDLPVPILRQREPRGMLACRGIKAIAPRRQRGAVDVADDALAAFHCPLDRETLAAAIEDFQVAVVP